eukprot:Partr_v1_DN25874_c0_g1_i2_m2565 putative La ribonucleoprotein domain family member
MMKSNISVDTTTTTTSTAKSFKDALSSSPGSVQSQAPRPVEADASPSSPAASPSPSKIGGKVWSPTGPSFAALLKSNISSSPVKSQSPVSVKSSDDAFNMDSVRSHLPTPPVCESPSPSASRMSSASCVSLSGGDGDGSSNVEKGERQPLYYASAPTSPLMVDRSVNGYPSPSPSSPSSSTYGGSTGGRGGFLRSNRGRGNGSSRGGGNNGRYRSSPHYINNGQQQQHHYSNSQQEIDYKLYIRAQVEFYFSIENLCRDMYLRKQMDANGCVAVAVLANFNRLKALGAGVDLICESVAESEFVELVADAGVRKRNDWHLFVLPPLPQVVAAGDASNVVAE